MNVKISQIPTNIPKAQTAALVKMTELSKGDLFHIVDWNKQHPPSKLFLSRFTSMTGISLNPSSDKTPHTVKIISNVFGAVAVNIDNMMRIALRDTEAASILCKKIGHEDSFFEAGAKKIWSNLKNILSPRGAKENQG